MATYTFLHSSILSWPACLSNIRGICQLSYTPPHPLMLTQVPQIFFTTRTHSQISQVCDQSAGSIKGGPACVGHKHGHLCMYPRVTRVSRG